MACSRTSLAALLICGAALSPADWLTFNHDAQRSGYNSAEKTLSKENIKDLRLLWSVQLDNAPLALSALTAPVVADDVQTASGKKTLVFFAGSSNTFFALDASSGALVWNRPLPSYITAKEESFYLCPNSANATPVIDRDRSLIYTVGIDGRVFGLDLATGDVKFGPFAFIPPLAKAWSLSLASGAVYTTTSQGCGGDRSGIYSINVEHPLSTTSHHLVVRQGSGGGMWLRGGTVIDPSGTVFVSTGDGPFNPAVGDYSNSYLAAPPDLSRVSDYFSPANWDTLSKRDLDLPAGGLAEFIWNGQRLLTGAGKESVVYLMAADRLGGPSHSRPLYATPVLANESGALEEKGIWGSPAVWADVDGPWLYYPVWGPLAPAARFAHTNGENPHGSLIALRVVMGDGGPRLELAWVSGDMSLPDAPVVANGIVFALSTGENPRQDHMLGVTHFKSMEEWKHNLLTTEERSAGTHPAVLVALDAKTGKMLYQSGDAMKTWVHFTGLAVTGGRVFAVDHQSRVYCFGLPEK